MRLVNWSVLAVALALAACGSNSGSRDHHQRSGDVRLTRPTIVEIRRGSSAKLVAASLKLTDTSGVAVYDPALLPIRADDQRLPAPEPDGSGVDECILCTRYMEKIPGAQWAGWTNSESELGPGQPCPCPKK